MKKEEWWVGGRMEESKNPNEEEREDANCQWGREGKGREGLKKIIQKGESRET